MRVSDAVERDENFSQLSFYRVHWNTSKVKQGRWWREKLREEKFWEKGTRETMSAPHSSATEPGPQSLLPRSAWACLRISAKSCQQVIIHLYLVTYSPKLLLLVPDLPLSYLVLSLFAHPWEELALWVMSLPLCYPYFNFLELFFGLSWLACTSPFTHISWHPILLENTMETFYSHSWPQTGTHSYTPNLDPFICYLHFMSIYWNLGSSSVYCRLTSVWNYLSHHSLGINEVAISSSQREAPLLLKLAGPMSRRIQTYNIETVILQTPMSLPLTHTHIPLQEIHVKG